MSACQRCGVETICTTMSMYSRAIICMDCKDKETKRPDYKQAEAQDLREYAGRLRGLGMEGSAQSVEKAADDILKGGKP